MKVVGIIGSPRRGGNTETLVERVLAGAAAAGAETQVFRLNEMNIRGCQACYYCKEHGRCRQEDDMVQIYRALLEADGIVLGSPIYMGYVTAQTKLFMDRLFAFLRPGLSSTFPPGKKFIMVYSQGGGDDREMVQGIAQRLGRILGMQVKGIAGGNGMNDLNAVKSNTALLEEAFRLGKELVV
ncbi:flavodoxin family protein [Desulfofundulus sp.]|uniref:flavodoxin family protein n=1 Tax=Desulfofundulus sp. TaxID=2282750 RepID=UPI003C72021A